MTEREPHPQPERVYWQDDLELASIAFGGEPTPVRMQVHLEAERYRQRDALFEQRNRGGIRDFLAARFSSLPPGHSTRDVDRSAEHTHQARQLLGSALAWHYREDHVAVLWECRLHEGLRHENPLEDLAYQQLWHAFEQHLAARFQPERILTPGWDPRYEEAVWTQFLVQQGYSPRPRRAFAKELPRPRVSQRHRRYR